MYKMVTREAPLYLQDAVPEVKHIGHNLRNSDAIPQMYGRTIFFDNTFIPRMIRDGIHFQDLPRKQNPLRVLLTPWE